MKVSFSEQGKGKPVLLLHAFPLSKKMWQSQIDNLVAANCRIITPDFRGFGDNPNFADINTMEDLAKDVAELMDNLKIEKAIIGGLSMGGYTLFNLFRLFPQKFAAMILADTNCGADTPEKRQGRFDLIEKIEKDGASALTENMLPNLISDFTKQNNSELVKALESDFSNVNPQAAIAVLRGMAAREDHCEYLEQISVPTLIVVGEQDKVTTVETAAMMHSKIRNSKLVRIQNSGHFSNIEQTDQFNNALREFVQSVEM